jgi:hypothetical protein
MIDDFRFTIDDVRVIASSANATLMKTNSKFQFLNLKQIIDHKFKLLNLLCLEFVVLEFRICLSFGI